MALQQMVPQYQEDATLTSKTSNEKFTYVLQKGIQNLFQWGQETFESGKHKTKEFQEIYQNDPQYVQYILSNQRLVSNDMRSFQNFCKAMKKKESQKTVKQGPIPIRKSKTPSTASRADSEWLPIEAEPPMPGVKMLVPTTEMSSAKRQLNDGGAQLSADSGDPDTDCHSSARTRSSGTACERPESTSGAVREDDPPIRLSKRGKVSMSQIQSKLVEVVHAIEDGLSNLPKSFTRTQKDRTDPGNNRPVVLLEVYILF